MLQSSESSDVPYTDCLDKSHILKSILAEKELLSSNEEGYDKFNKLQKLIEKLDLSVLETDEDKNVLPSTSKQRKTSRHRSKHKDRQRGKDEKEVEKAKKQIKLVEKALAIVYDMEDNSFKKFISKHGKDQRTIISKVHFLKRINDNGKLLPLWISKEDETPPQLCGGIQADKNYVAKVGDIVAALVKQDKEKNWILAEVVSYDPNKREYVVDDVYEDPKREQRVSREKLIPLPKYRADPDTHSDALFPKDSLVLALYPGTTCFYPAAVGDIPKSAQDPYKLLFEDDSCESSYSSPICVHQCYVLRFEPTSK